MTFTQLWGALFVFFGCPLLGALPLISWLTFGLTGLRLQRLGTGNISVSAAFYHGGTLPGILAVLSEAGKGIAAVLITRQFFPADPVWEILALIALVCGRYWAGRGAGTTNVVWGIVVHDPISAGLILLIGGISFTVFRDRKTAKYVVLVLLGLTMTLRHLGDPPQVVAAWLLAILIGWIYQSLPDDLDLPSADSRSRSMLRFLQGQKLLTLNETLKPAKAGQKAATLAQLRSWQYPVPDGWIVQAGDDPQRYLSQFAPSPENPLIVRSSATNEDSADAAAAGQYLTIANVNSREALQAAITEVFASYYQQNAVQYRRDRKQTDGQISVLIQRQVHGQISGVAFSRDPIDQLNHSVVIEAVRGGADLVVSGEVTPQRYQVTLPQPDADDSIEIHAPANGDLPEAVIIAIAKITRELEDRYHGLPQDVEWTHDGEQLWLLQSRPISTLQPIWTRKIAAEVIPGNIRPLTWSINRPLTCGVWGDIFALLLGSEKAAGLDFQETATLHFSRAYFNASLLGEIFRRSGLPPESLEFLTRGTRLSRPSLSSTLGNLPGLWRLLQKELQLLQDFDRDRDLFAPTLDQLEEQPVTRLTPPQLLERIDDIFVALERATYYNILAPLSFAIRKALSKVDDSALDYLGAPEVASIESLRILAKQTRRLLPTQLGVPEDRTAAFCYLTELPDGEEILNQFDEWLTQYGYLSEVATDIAVPRWQEAPRPVRDLFVQLIFETPKYPPAQPDVSETAKPKTSLWTPAVQKRLDLKNQINKIYSQLLAHLRWSFLAIANQWQQERLIAAPDDIFFLELGEIRAQIEETLYLPTELQTLITQRKEQWQLHQKIDAVPFVIFGEPAADLGFRQSELPPERQLQGIPASPGIVEGQARVIRRFADAGQVDKECILVVPFTDSGWAALLAGAAGIVAETGGQLSHGAIVAREYGIPAIMDVPNACSRFRNGQRLKLDGRRGVIEILEEA
ncbi:MAG: glycerol-3-phosphate acyltransferase [Cyanobacteria bacterium P01_H01_bin.15]